MARRRKLQTDKILDVTSVFKTLFNNIIIIHNTLCNGRFHTSKDIAWLKLDSNENRHDFRFRTANINTNLWESDKMF